MSVREENNQNPNQGSNQNPNQGTNQNPNDNSNQNREEGSQNPNQQGSAQNTGQQGSQQNPNQQGFNQNAGKENKPFEITGNWGKQSTQLKEQYSQLTDTDLKFEPGKENQLLDQIGTKLNKSRDEVIDIINRCEV